ncbi:MAG: outer membrane protein assembly factor BamE [Endomicrobium sp.]|jgi:hypothetical protein|nr:outer membrane protein assembly factor BamE [Endomicrobium sp.]
MKPIVALFLCFCTLFAVSENCFAEKIGSDSINFKKIDKIHCGMSKEEVLKIMGGASNCGSVSQSQCLCYDLSGRDKNRRSKYFVHFENGIVDSYGRLDNFGKSIKYEFHYCKKGIKSNECCDEFYVLNERLGNFSASSSLVSFGYECQANVKNSNNWIKKFAMRKSNKDNLLHPSFLELIPLMTAIAHAENITDLNILYKKALAAKKA